MSLRSIPSSLQTSAVTHSRQLNERADSGSAIRPCRVSRAGCAACRAETMPSLDRGRTLLRQTARIRSWRSVDAWRRD
jgi:hypothetical protein